MKKNVGNIDRVARVVLAILISVLYFTDVITGTLGIVFMVFAGVFALTSLSAYETINAEMMPNVPRLCEGFFFVCVLVW